MRVEVVDLSKYTDQVSENYKRLSKTQIRLLSSQVPESFIEKFKDEETALLELLDTIYGTIDNDYDL
ncbi:MAG: hypothetical protein EB168_08970 [Euryarchaeota archaeon]|nr:hypothetical protein [Euryarchaeota archaeon]